MRTLLAISLALVVGLSGCSTLGIGTGGDTATRILADVMCLTALVTAGITVAGDPSVQGASTAIDVLTAIGTIGASSVPATVLAACKETLAYAAEDAKGLLALVSGSTGTTAPKLAPKAMRSAAPPKAPAKPQSIQVVIPK